MTFFPDKPFDDLPPLPPEGVQLENQEVLKQLIVTRSQLSELKQAVLRIPNPEILISTIGLREAQSSSEIENLVTTTDKLFKADVDSIESTDLVTKEVIRYRQALLHGYNELKTGRPLGTRLFEDIVKIIRNTQEGIRKVSGIKIANQKTSEVIYTPPQGEELVRKKLSELEKFMYSDSDLDPLVKLSLLHYQFEAIHPFSDGNGRTGRIINILFLFDQKLLSYPILFLSRYILKNKENYYRGLREVTTNQDWQNWIMFMLHAVSDSACDTLNRINKICILQENVSNLIKNKAPKIYSHELVKAIFTHPYTKISFLEQLNIAKRQTASKYLDQLASLKILEVFESGRDKYFINHGLVDILTEN